MRRSARAHAWAVTAVALTIVPVLSWAGITGSAHDLSAAGYGTDQICIFCHTPHDAKTPQIAPLWNHTSTTQTFILYSSPTMDQTPVQPRERSKTCLSCHDGVTAIDSYGDRVGTTPMTGDKVIGTDLSDDHPISVLWRHQTLPSNPDCSKCHWPPEPLPFYDFYLECATCHEPHNKYPQFAPMLRKSLTASELCQICHQK